MRRFSIFAVRLPQRRVIGSLSPENVAAQIKRWKAEAVEALAAASA
jgi:hypothetical protein